MTNYCTFFDSGYLTRGLALYNSLRRFSDQFHLYVAAMDDSCYDALNEMNLYGVSIIKLSQIEDEEMSAAKTKYGWREYCFSCTPSIIKKILNDCHLESCIYVDSDICFYASPQILIREWEESNKSVLITKHNYSEITDPTLPSGLYCVQFVGFKNDIDGNGVLSWWREQCLKECKSDIGYCYDQKYLDDWTSRFPSVHVLKHEGALAPWNVDQYELKVCGPAAPITAIHKITKESFEAVFYHYHGLKFFTDDKVEIAGSKYNINSQAYSLFYIGYINNLINCEKNDFHNISLQKNPNGKQNKSPNFFERSKSKIKGCFNRAVNIFKEDHDKYRHISPIKFDNGRKTIIE